MPVIIVISEPQVKVSRADNKSCRKKTEHSEDEFLRAKLKGIHVCSCYASPSATPAKYKQMLSALFLDAIGYCRDLINFQRKRPGVYRGPGIRECHFSQTEPYPQCPPGDLRAYRVRKGALVVYQMVCPSGQQMPLRRRHFPLRPSFTYPWMVWPV